jgi:hypothetical protein
MVLPVGHVGRREEPPVAHVEVCAAVFVVPSEEVDGVVVDEGRGVGGVDCLDKGVVGLDGSW